MAKASSTKTPSGVYPQMTSTYITNPSRFWAIPLLGFVLKVIILIPVFIEFMFLGIAWIIVAIINSFMVLFTGKYWHVMYELTLGIMRLSLKVDYFLFGLTNKYPGFGFTINDTFSLDIAMPKNPSRFFAIPLLGFIARVILLIPYSIFVQVLGSASFIGVFWSSIAVLFKGRYPESVYELSRDAFRVNFSSMAYMAGLSDSYPSFSIDLKNHQFIKIILIILGVLSLFANVAAPHPKANQQYQYNQTDNSSNSLLNGSNNTY